MRPKKKKDHGIHKDTLQEIIKLVLMRGAMIKPELLKAIPNVSKRGIEQELAKQKDGGVLSVNATRGGNSNHTTVSLNQAIKDAIAGIEVAQQEKWSSFLAKADSLIRRFSRKVAAKFAPTSKHNESINNNAPLGHVEASSSQRRSITGLANNNEPLEEDIDAKTPLFEAVCITSNIKNRTTTRDKINNLEKAFKNNWRSRNATRFCADKSPAKQGQQTVYKECFDVGTNLPKEAVDALQEKLRRLCFDVGTNSGQNTNPREAVVDIMLSMAKGMAQLSCMTATRPAKPDKPRLESVSKPESDNTMAQPIETGEPTGTKPRKERKSRKGQSGSFPKKHLPYYESQSIERCHPKYDKVSQPERDLRFARAYDGLVTKRGLSVFHSAYTIAAQSLTDLQESPYHDHIHKARLRADYYGARYEDYVEAVFDWYEEMNDGRKKKATSKVPKYPPPKQLYGDGAIASYQEWLENQTNIPYTRDPLFPEYFPESYTGEEYQIKYFTRMMESVRVICQLRHAHIHHMLDDLICNKIMSREFAEDPDMNRLLPGYKYGLAA
jgi:hypothetical protein